MEFRIAFRWRLLAYLSSPLFAGLGFMITYQSVFSLDSISFSTNYILGFTLAILAFWFALYFPIRMFREKLTIQKDRFIYRLAIKTKVLLFEDIEGFRIDNSYFRISAKPELHKPLNISRYLERNSDLVEYLYQNFDDLVAADRAKEASELFGNDAFGEEEQVIEERFLLAKKTSKWVNIFAFVLAALTLFYPYPYELIILLNLLLPFIGITVIIHFKGLIRIDKKPDSIYPSVYGSILLPICGLGIRIIYDFNYISTMLIWIYSIPLALIFFLILFSKSDELGFSSTSQSISTIILALLMYIYSCCAISMVDVLFDTSSVETHWVEVSRKSKSDKFNRLKLTPGWHESAIKEVTGNTSSNFYNSVQVGDSVMLNVRNGALNIPWYIVEELRKPSVDSFDSLLPIPDSLWYQF